MALPRMITIKNLEEMKRFAQGLSQNIPRPSTIGLVGRLGVGKTTLVRFVLKALGNARPVTSPTFVWLKTYSLKGQRYNKLHHIDAYRLTKLDPELTSAIIECQRDPRAITIIEWADRVRSLLVPKATLLHFSLDKQKIRRLKRSRLA